MTIGINPEGLGGCDLRILGEEVVEIVSVQNIIISYNTHQYEMEILSKECFPEIEISVYILNKNSRDYHDVLIASVC